VSGQAYCAIARLGARDVPRRDATAAALMLFPTDSWNGKQEENSKGRAGTHTAHTIRKLLTNMGSCFSHVLQNLCTSEIKQAEN